MEIIRNKPRKRKTNNVLIPKLLCCRACLSTDSKLLNIHEYNLTDEFSCISGSSVFGDGLPQHLCVYCCALLKKCTSFRDMCLWTQQHLSALLQAGVTLTTDYIRTIDKPSHQPVDLYFTGAETIDCIETLPKYDVKLEPLINIVDIDSVINPVDLKTEHEDEKDEEKLNDDTEEAVVVKRIERKRKSETKLMKTVKIEYDTEENEIKDYEEDGASSQLRINIKDKKRNDVRVNKTAKEEVESKDDNIVIIHTDDRSFNDEEDIGTSQLIRDVRDKKRKDVRVNKTAEKKGDNKNDNTDDNVNDVKPVKAKRKRKKKEVTRQFRKAENDFMPVFDFGKFESAYGVRVVVLTKEEQLAEIEERKSSENYLSCPFRCEDCGKGFLAEEPYNNHRKRHSPSMGPHACEICSVRFKIRCRRQEHQDRHRLKFFCTACSFVSRNRHQARQHQEVHTGKTFECQHCGKTFTKSSTYLSHVRLAHPSMHVACDICGETFLGHMGLRQHKAKMHSEITKPEQFKCSTCAATFVSLDALNKHTDTTDDHSDLSPCERCGENCSDADSLNAHVKEKHNVEEHRCEECSQTFASAASYSLHHRRKHLNERFSCAGQRRPVRPRQHIGRFICEQCGQIKPTATHLRLHMRVHQTEKPFKCAHCPKAFVAKNARDFHERTHTGERPFQCPQCPLKFSHNSNMKRHHNAVHLGLRKSFPCSICARVFTTSSGLRIHVNTSHKGLPWPKRVRRKKNKDSGE